MQRPFSPATASDNGAITGYQIISVVPPLTTAPTVNAAGVVSITNALPTGAHIITVRATDNCGAPTDASFTLTVGCPTITVTPSALPAAFAGTLYTQSFAASGGAGTSNFSVNAGTLPGGLTLSAAGVLNGTPTATGTFNFTVRATDSNGCTGDRPITLVVKRHRWAHR